MTPCELCGSDSNNYFVCFICAGHAAQLIREAMTALPMLTKARQSHDGAQRAGHPGSKPPVSLHAVTVADELLRDIAQVAAVMHVPVSALLDNLNRIKLTSGLGHALDRLGDTYRKALTIINPPEEVQLLGHCNECDGQLVTTKGASQARCQDCGLVLTNAPMIRAMRAAFIHAHTMTIAEACRIFEQCGLMVKERTAQNWAKRGHLTRDTEGLIRLGDLLAVIQSPPQRGRPATEEHVGAP